uniref:uncharacterized protein LOC112431165 isoform X1 n=1 Tax=Maylandia zebra TaxID=106582 RepID=UPI000D321108|nr:uncharacterized protein LOC112431165 isoform X1 [Maylandia zebra]
MCCNIPALLPDRAAQSAHAGRLPQAESSGTAPHDRSVEKTGPGLPRAAASNEPAGQQGGAGEGRPVGADPGQGRLCQGHLQREALPACRGHGGCHFTHFKTVQQTRPGNPGCSRPAGTTGAVSSRGGGYYLSMENCLA